MIRIMEDFSGDWRRLDERIQHITEEIEVLAHGSESCRQLMTVPGIGPLIARRHGSGHRQWRRLCQGH
jgi:transposase